MRWMDDSLSFLPFTTSQHNIGLQGWQVNESYKYSKGQNVPKEKELFFR